MSGAAPVHAVPPRTSGPGSREACLAVTVLLDADQLRGLLGGAALEAVGAASPEAPGGGIGALSARERDVLALMASGLTNAGVARRLSVSVRTVEAHVRSILAKLAVPESDEDHRRVLAVLAYLGAGRG